MGVMSHLLTWVRLLIDSIIKAVFGWYYSDKKKAIPPVSQQFLTESAVSIASKIRTGELTSEIVVRAYVDRIKEVNGILNAVVDERFEAAIQEAKDIDRNISNVDFSQKPFLGVPFTSKESTACAGMLHTFGIEARRGRRASQDADIVALMKGAGAVLLAVTNVPEVNLWQETRSTVYGQTCNPYDSTRTAGGSSGGEASVVAACGSAFGLGTDIGGSTRMPAFFCGVFGHKPSSYLVSTRGLTRRTGTERPTMVVAGPLCRHAEDLAPLLTVLLGRHARLLRLDEPVDLCALRYCYVAQSGDGRTSPVCGELASLMERVVAHIRTQLGPVAQLQPAQLCYASRLWRYWMSCEQSNFAHELTDRRGAARPLPELCRKLLGAGRLTAAALLKLADDAWLPRENARLMRRLTQELRDLLLAELRPLGVLLYPSFPWPASFHGTALLQPYNFSYFSVFNVLRFPATQVPLGLSVDGLPLGLQVVAAPRNDRLCFAVARHLEREFGGYVTPPPPAARD